MDKDQELKLAKSAPEAAHQHPVLLTDSGSITKVDGLVIRELLWSGTQLLVDRMDLINKINLFPIPDSDTGTVRQNHTVFLLPKLCFYFAFTTHRTW